MECLSDIFAGLVVALLFAAFGALVAGGVFGFACAVGAPYTPARLLLALLSGAGLGGLTAVGTAVREGDQRKTAFVAFGLLISSGIVGMALLIARWP